MATLAVVSVLSFFASLWLTRWILVRLPAHFFDVRVPRAPFFADRHPVVRAVAHVIKNLIGYVLIAAGIVMLFIPGPGALTILLGLSLVDFPAKRRLEAWLIGRPLVLQGINAMRKRFGQEPFVVAPD